MRDRLVAGIAHQEVKRKLLSERKLTFQIVKETLENWNDINSAMSKSSEVFAVPSRRNSDQCNSGRAAFPRRNPGVPRYNNQDKHSAAPSRTPHPNNNRSGRCDSCGGQHSRRTCRFRTVQCRNCNKNRTHSLSVPFQEHQRGEYPNHGFRLGGQFQDLRGQQKPSLQNDYL